jgi:hypothetical protein
MIMRRFAVAFLFLVASTLAGWAQTYTTEQLDALKTRLTVFENGIRNKDYQVMSDIIPRTIWENIKTKAKITDAQLVEAIKATMMQTFETATITDFKMDMAAATTHALADGMLYMMIPTSTTVAVKESGTFKSSSATLAIIENDVWYLMRVSDKAQITILHEVYPAFKSVTLPEDKLEKIEE